jgi:hypothetical protein
MDITDKLLAIEQQREARERKNERARNVVIALFVAPPVIIVGIALIWAVLNIA